MSGVLLHDTRRNIPEWAMDAVAGGAARGLIVNPFDSPPVSSNSPPREGAVIRVERVRQAEGLTFFDPCTHALTFATDFTSYGAWNLWREDSQPGALAEDSDRRWHIRRVFETQRELGLPLLAPTVEIQSPSSEDAQIALKLAEASVAGAEGAALVLPIVGTEGFWSSAADLDDFIAMLAQYQPAGWILTVVRGGSHYPARVSGAEIAGMCRTVRSLAAWGADVIVAYGDMAALPAVVAGASYVGSGWDISQRAFSRSAFQVPLGTEGGGWLQRITHKGLMAALRRNEARTLADADPPLSELLVPGVIPTAPRDVGERHFRILSEYIDELRAINDLEARVQRLQVLYRQAANRLAMVHAVVPLQERSHWVAGCLDGLNEFARQEGLDSA